MTAQSTGTALNTSELRAMLVDNRYSSEFLGSAFLRRAEALLDAADERDALLAEVEHLRMRLGSLNHFADALAQMSLNLHAALATDTTTEDS